MSGDFAGKGLSYNGHMLVLQHMLNYDYLWQNIRVTGGAYGCGGSFTREGAMNLRSFRDPHLRRTLEVYRKTPDYIREFSADEGAMTKFVIGTVSSVDTPMTPTLFDSFSMKCYMNGLTEEMRQKTRDELLSTTPEDIRALEGAVRAALEDDCFCVIGSRGAVEKNKALFDHIENLI